LPFSKRGLDQRLIHGGRGGTRCRVDICAGKEDGGERVEDNCQCKNVRHDDHGEGYEGGHIQTNIFPKRNGKAQYGYGRKKES